MSISSFSRKLYNFVGLLCFLLFVHNTHFNILFPCTILYNFFGWCLPYSTELYFMWSHITCLLWSKASHLHQTWWAISINQAYSNLNRFLFVWNSFSDIFPDDPFVKLFRVCSLVYFSSTAWCGSAPMISFSFLGILVYTGNQYIQSNSLWTLNSSQRYQTSLEVTFEVVRAPSAAWCSVRILIRSFH